MNFEEMKNALVRAALAEGLTQYEIYFCKTEEISAETLKEVISAFASSASGGICFRCIVNGKMGYASGELFEEDAMEELVKNAVSNAACIDSEDEVFIFEGSPAYQSISAEPPVLATASELCEAALTLQKQLYLEDARVGEGTQSAAASVTEEVCLYNSNGLSLSNRVGVSVAYAMPVVRQGDDAQQSFEYCVGLDEAARAGLPQRAVRRAIERLGAVELASGKYDIVLDGDVFRQFLSAFSPVFSAKNAQQGLSLLAGKEGERIASPCVTLTDDPRREGSPMQTPFDGEGVAAQRKRVIDGGVLCTLLYDLTTAKKAGVASTGNGQKASYSSPVSIAPYHFAIEAGAESLESLCAAVGNGIYITSSKGFHAGANAVTGDFSIESAGFVIRNGALAEPIKSFTVAGNFFDLLRSVDGVGSTIKWGIPASFTVFGSPDLLIRGVSVAGK